MPVGKKRNKRKKTSCFNCERKLKADDNFCFNCGQENHDKKAPIALLIGDFFGDYLTIDSKFLVSVKELFFKPGAMTLAYTNGKRQKYIKPIRLYLFVSFIFFLCLNLIADQNNFFEPTTTTADSGNVNFTFNNSEDTTTTFQPLATLQDSLEAIVFSDTASIEQKKVANELLKSQATQMAGMFQQMMGLIPYVGFTMVPMMALVLMLFYRRQKKYFVEHFIFSIHVHTLTFALLSIVIGIKYFFPDIIELVPWTLLLIGLHTIVAMRKMYRCSWGYLPVVSIFGTLTYLVLFTLVLFGFLMLIIATGSFG